MSETLNPRPAEQTQIPTNGRTSSQSEPVSSELIPILSGGEVPEGTSTAKKLVLADRNSSGEVGILRESSIVSVAESANYKGNWMLLQQDRMNSDDFRSRFSSLMERQVASLKPGEPTGMFDKPQDFAGHYAQQIGNLTSNVENVYNRVDYISVGAGRAAVLGTSGGLGEPGTVYADSGLTDRQKDIIAAHEAAHGILQVDGAGSAKKEVLACFDLEALQNITDVTEAKRPGYLKNPDELLARMSQLKNYFGMSAGEPFTEEHLKYAKEHYIVDTGLDNSMSTFFAVIRPESFINGMNNLPI